MAPSYLEPPRPRTFGHRGAAALAPENTLPSFQLGSALGAKYLELDVHGTADGEVVVLHDASVDRTTNGSGAINSLTFAEARDLDAGYRFTDRGGAFPFRGQEIAIPSLGEVVAAFPDHYFNIEIKQHEPSIVAQVVDILRTAKATGRTLLAAENDATMKAIRNHVNDEIATGSSTGDVLAFFGNLEQGTLDSYVHPGVALQIPTHFGDRELVTQGSVEAAHRCGVEVHVWTVNDAAEMERLFDLNVDGIISDTPGLVAAAARRRRQPHATR